MGEKKSFLVGFFALALFTLAATGICAAATDLARPDAGGAPTRVQVGLYLADLYEISGGDQTFGADVVLKAEWNDPRLAGRWTGLKSMGLDEVWHPRLQLVNQRGVSATLPQRVEVDPSGRVLYRQRWWGRFTGRMDFRLFPMDRQRFHVQVVSLGYPRGEVEMVPSSEANGGGKAATLSLTDWEVGPARMEIRDYESGVGMKPLSGVELAWDGQRHFGYHAVQVILPLVMIVLMGCTALWVDPSVVNTRISVSVTTMLTLIAYRFALGRLVPNLPYLTRFDYFTLGSTVLVFLMLVVVAWCAYLFGRDRKPLVDRIDRWARIGFPVLYAVLCLLVWWR